MVLRVQTALLFTSDKSVFTKIEPDSTKQNDLHWASSVVEDSLSDALPPMLCLNRPPADQKHQ